MENLQRTLSLSPDSSTQDASSPEHAASDPIPFSIKKALHLDTIIETESEYYTLGPLSDNSNPSVFKFPPSL
jgi:hypothetical protein